MGLILIDKKKTDRKFKSIITKIRGDCRIFPFILYRQVHPFADSWIRFAWNVTVRFICLHKILTVENDAKVCVFTYKITKAPVICLLFTSSTLSPHTVHRISLTRRIKQTKPRGNSAFVVTSL